LGAANNSQTRGRGGNINITAENLSLQDGGVIGSSTFARGRAGNIRIDADRLSIVGVTRLGFSSGLYTVSTAPATGRSGDVTINANGIQLSDSAVITAQTLSDRRGGNINLNANIFTATNGGQVVTTTARQGRAGTIRLNADVATLTGNDPDFNQRLRQQGVYTVINGNRGTTTQNAASGLYANTSRISSGRGGNVVVNAGNLTVEDNARISVGSRGEGTGGRISLRTESTSLDRGQLLSNTNRTNSGNINIQSDTLTLRDRSRIATDAGNAANPGNGGNININANTTVAISAENSDITANAFTGNGGKVNITTQGIIGLEATPTNTATSNITASSDRGVQGAVNLNTPDLNPGNGLTQLPAIFTDVSSQINQACSNASRNLSEFVVSGRGGLPPTPFEPLTGSEPIGQLLLPPVAASPIPAEPSEPASSLVEAQGWAIAPNGKVMLVTQGRSLVPLPRSFCPPRSF
jgi:large exoprotein involved in heme utilization and adhesion